MRVALVGGSFDPPHLAHQVACLYLLQGEGFGQVWLLPCFRHAFGKPLAPYQHRLAMCRLLAAPFGDGVQVSEVESELIPTEGVNRTVDTVETLQRRHPGLDFSFVIGSDLLSQVPAWKEFARLRGMLPFLVLQRPGFTARPEGFCYSSIALPEISSTVVRERLAQGQPLAGLVPVEVARYLEQHQLYR
jgi:nicotinate-nucleotide adenylyltransferase